MESSTSAWTISDEERTRYDALFYSQNPVEGLLTGDKARELLLRSKLPLQTLSRIWRLSDLNRDNMLDVEEFAIAMHLIHCQLSGTKIPTSLPTELIPTPQPTSEVCVMTVKEREAYRQVFHKQDKNRIGYITGIVNLLHGLESQIFQPGYTAIHARNIFVSSKLPIGSLAQVWNLSDIDRDGKLDCDEFAIALHLLRFIKRGNQIHGSINVLHLLPDKVPYDSLEGKRRRIAEVEIKKQKLLAIKEKTRLEMEKETKRAELEKDKIRVMQMKLEAQKEHWSKDSRIVQLSNIEQEEKQLKFDTLNLEKLQVAVSRLAADHDKLLQEEIRLNLEEERLQHEKRLYEKEADEVKQEAARNRVSREIDPFHSLHERRKEERKKGIIPPLNSPLSSEAESPFQSSSQSGQPQFTGGDLFSCRVEVPTSPAGSIFEDNFVDISESEAEFTISVELDTDFKTVSVSAEEDDLWSSIPNTPTNQVEAFESAPNESQSTNPGEAADNGSKSVYPNEAGESSSGNEFKLTKPIEADDGIPGNEIQPANPILAYYCAPGNDDQLTNPVAADESAPAGEVYLTNPIGADVSQNEAQSPNLNETSDTVPGNKKQSASRIVLINSASRNTIQWGSNVEDGKSTPGKKNQFGISTPGNEIQWDSNIEGNKSTPDTKNKLDSSAPGSEIRWGTNIEDSTKHKFDSGAPGNDIQWGTNIEDSESTPGTKHKFDSGAPGNDIQWGTNIEDSESTPGTKHKFDSGAPGNDIQWGTNIEDSESTPGTKHKFDSGAPGNDIQWDTNIKGNKSTPGTKHKSDSSGPWNDIQWDSHIEDSKNTPGNKNLVDSNIEVVDNAPGTGIHWADPIETYENSPGSDNQFDSSTEEVDQIPGTENQWESSIEGVDNTPGNDIQWANHFEASDNTPYNDSQLTNQDEEPVEAPPVPDRLPTNLMSVPALTITSVEDDNDNFNQDENDNFNQDEDELIEIYMLDENNQKVNSSEVEWLPSDETLDADAIKDWENSFLVNNNSDENVVKVTGEGVLGDENMEIQEKRNSFFSSGDDDDDDSFYVTKPSPTEVVVDDNDNIGQLIDFGQLDEPIQPAKVESQPFYMSNDFSLFDSKDEESSPPQTESSALDDLSDLYGPPSVDSTPPLTTTSTMDIPPEILTDPPAIPTLNTDIQPQKEYFQVCETDNADDDDDIKTYTVTTDTVQSYKCTEEEDKGEKIDDQPIDKQAMIKQWENTLASCNDPPEDYTHKKKRPQLKKKLNVYLDPTPKFKKKEVSDESVSETLTAEDCDNEQEKIRKDVIAMQKVKKRSAVSWNPQNDYDDDEVDMAPLDEKKIVSLQQYEERKKKSKQYEVKLTPAMNSGPKNDPLNESRDSGLGDTLKSLSDEQHQPETDTVLPVNRQNGNQSFESSVDDKHINRAALLEQWNKKLSFDEPDDIDAIREKEKRVREEIQKDVEADSISDSSKTRLEWEKRFSIHRDTPAFVPKQQVKTRDMEEHSVEVEFANPENQEVYYCEPVQIYTDGEDEGEEEEEIPENETIIERDIRLQRQRERQLQKQRQIAKGVYESQRGTDFIGQASYEIDEEGEEEEEEDEEEDYFEPLPPRPEEYRYEDTSYVEDDDDDTQAPQQSGYGLSTIERDILEQRQKEEELRREGRVKNVSVSMFAEDEEESDRHAKTFESSIEREIREHKEREEMLRKERGLPTPPSEPDDSYLAVRENTRVSFDDGDVTPPGSPDPKTKGHVVYEPHHTEVRNTDSVLSFSERKQMYAKPDDRRREINKPVAKTTVTPSKPQQRTKEVILVEQEQVDEKIDKDEKVDHEYIHTHASDDFGFTMDENNPPPPVNESIIEREIRLQREREIELQRQRAAAGVVKSTEDTGSVVNNNNHYTATKPVSRTRKADDDTDSPSNVEAKSRTAQARAIFNQPTKTTQQQSVPSKPVHSVQSKIVTPTSDDKQITSESSTKSTKPTQNGPTETVTTHKETPIEREIRLAREKEDIYREERGLPSRHDRRPSTYTERRKPTEVEETPVPTSKHYHSADPVAKDQYMKRAAGYYIERDMAESRRKEEELKKEGKIRRLSTRSKEDDNETDGVNGPAGESIVEREIRRQREREETFKREHGAHHPNRPSDLRLENANGSSVKSPTSSVDTSSHGSLSPPPQSPVEHVTYKPGYAKYMNQISHTPSPSSSSSPSTLGEDSSTGSEYHDNKSYSKPMKRKSLLASQWEDKFK
ncbi:uncharacterized protein LOC144436806 [Glandiceps talaboti]